MLPRRRVVGRDQGHGPGTRGPGASLGPHARDGSLRYGDPPRGHTPHTHRAPQPDRGPGPPGPRRGMSVFETSGSRTETSPCVQQILTEHVPCACRALFQRPRP